MVFERESSSVFNVSQMDQIYANRETESLKGIGNPSVMVIYSMQPASYMRILRMPSLWNVIPADSRRLNFAVRRIRRRQSKLARWNRSLQRWRIH